MNFKEKIEHIKQKLDKYSPYPVLYSFIMSHDEQAVFDEYIKESRNYLEFGFGGSTLRAIQKSKANIYTVESSKDWINKMMEYFILRYSKDKRLHIFHIDIGPTKAWGYPKSNDNQDLFEAYSSKVFESIDSKSIDLVLIDGRFRVACTLKTILSCHENKDLKILIHDFWNRDYYHTVLKYLNTINKTDTLGVFTIKDNIDLAAIHSDYEAYKLEPK